MPWDMFKEVAKKATKARTLPRYEAIPAIFQRGIVRLSYHFDPNSAFSGEIAPLLAPRFFVRRKCFAPFGVC